MIIGLVAPPDVPAVTTSGFKIGQTTAFGEIWIGFATADLLPDRLTTCSASKPTLNRQSSMPAACGNESGIASFLAGNANGAPPKQRNRVSPMTRFHRAVDTALSADRGLAVARILNWANQSENCP
jgi:hypothetical protein